jgi:SWI/SNF-related matrix-associated actin-dependent regulator of chromatin subfamily A member 5
MFSLVRLLFQYGYGQWAAIKMAIRRSPKFRFDYFLRSLPIDMIGRRCEHLMRAALKEVEQLEKKVREDEGLPVDVEDGSELPPVVLPKFKDMQKRIRQEKMEIREKEKKILEKKVEDLEAQITEIQDRLKALSKDPEASKENRRTSSNTPAPSSIRPTEEALDFDESKAALGPDGEVVEFPEYDGSEPPKEPKKTFALFCNRMRKQVKASLDPEDRKDKERVNGILRDRFVSLSEEEKKMWRAWAAWDKKRYEHSRMANFKPITLLNFFEFSQRYARDLKTYERRNGTLMEASEERHDQSKRRNSDGAAGHVPKKKRRGL